MTSPVMTALANQRYQEASVFGRFALMRGIKPLPAQPAHVADFVREMWTLTSNVGKIWEAVQEVSHSHLSNGLADPTAGGPVAAAMNEISKLQPPRSWRKDFWPRWHALPWDVQNYLTQHEEQRDRVVRDAQNQAGDLRHKLKLLEQKEPNVDTTKSQTPAA
jgi:hypothetical protein